jgi:hypothetical protein
MLTESLNRVGQSLPLGGQQHGLSRLCGSVRFGAIVTSFGTYLLASR